MHRRAQWRHLLNRAMASAHPSLAFPRGQVRNLRTVIGPTTVAFEFRANRPSRSFQLEGDPALSPPRLQSGLNLDALIQIQRRVAHPPDHNQRGGVGKRRNRSATAEPVTLRFLRFGSPGGLVYTSVRCCSILRRIVLVAHSNSSLSAPFEPEATLSRSELFISLCTKEPSIFTEVLEKLIAWSADHPKETKVFQFTAAGLIHFANVVGHSKVLEILNHAGEKAFSFETIRDALIAHNNHDHLDRLAPERRVTVIEIMKRITVGKPKK